MNPEDDAAWRVFYEYGFSLGTNENTRREAAGMRICGPDPEYQLRRYRATIYRLLGPTDAARFANKVVDEGRADALEGREPRC